jgi:hypothetical protein
MLPPPSPPTPTPFPTVTPEAFLAPLLASVI